MYWFSRRHKNETFFIIQCSLHYFNKNNKHCPVYHCLRSSLYRNAILALKSLTDHEGEEGVHSQISTDISAYRSSPISHTMPGAEELWRSIKTNNDNTSLWQHAWSMLLVHWSKMHYKLTLDSSQSSEGRQIIARHTSKWHLGKCVT